MDQNLINETLKHELKKAIAMGNKDEIEKLTKLLKISPEQTKYFDKGLTGFPSIDQVWLDKYKDGAYDLANNIPEDKTVWDVIEEKLLEYYDITAIEYFKRQITRENFRDNVYRWARTFRAMGVEENEVVPVYGPFFPDIAAMVFALNTIGAVPYFLKLAISPEALEEETREAKVAVVYDGMWANVANEFSKARFKKVLVATASDAMPSPKKEIVSFLSGLAAKKNHSQIPDDKKYVWLDDALKIAEYYTGEVKVPFVKNRDAFITSSSGTTVGGVVKGTVATNESTISQLYMADASDVLYFPGEKVLNHFPPTASTSLNILFMLPLYRGMTIMMDPRVSEKDFYNQIMLLKPQLAVNTGSAWEAFFNRIEKEMAQGKKFDFSYARGWVVGGEGTDVNKFLRFKRIMTLCGAPDALASAYGTSEVFSAACTEKSDARYDFRKQIMSVGIPYAGMTAGVFDEKGNELSYNQRGDLRLKSKSIMKGYYNKPELTNKSMENGWYKTGDMAEIDADGFVYVWGRMTDKITLDNGENVYLFDVANIIKELEFIDDAIVLSMPLTENRNNLVAHIVFNKKYGGCDTKELLDMINLYLNKKMGYGLQISAYSIHDNMLPYSPTTLKKDKNGMSNQHLGYLQVIDNELKNIEFVVNDDGLFDIVYENVKVK